MEILSYISDGSQRNAAFFVDGQKILIGLRHYASGAIWTTPGGKCDADETILMSLEREVAEEVGITNFEIIAYLGSRIAADKK